MQATTQDTQKHRDSECSKISELMTKLGGHDGVERQHAREALVALGKQALGPLIAALSSDRDVVRWEAAKAFTELEAPEAAPALVRTLTDEDGDVRWLAAEALIALGEVALAPLFEALIARSDSLKLREGAHHVLRSLNNDGLRDVVGPVVSTLKSYEPELAVPFSAEVALAKLRKRRF